VVKGSISYLNVPILIILSFNIRKKRVTFAYELYRNCDRSAKMNNFVLIRAEEKLFIPSMIKLHFTEQDNRDEPVGNGCLLMNRF
jgi:hypothetical protein